MKSAIMILAAALLTTGCGRDDGRGTSSPGASTEWGERGITNNVNSVGSLLGPLGATQISGGLVTTGTAAELLKKTPSGQPVPPSQQVPREK